MHFQVPTSPLGTCFCHCAAKNKDIGLKVCNDSLKQSTLHLFGVFRLVFALNPYVIEAIARWPFLDPKSRDMMSSIRDFSKTSGRILLKYCVEMLKRRRIK